MALAPQPPPSAYLARLLANFAKGASNPSLEFTEGYLTVIAHDEFRSEDVRSLLKELVRGEYVRHVRDEAEDADTVYKVEESLFDLVDQWFLGTEGVSNIPDFDYKEYYEYRLSVLGAIIHAEQVFGDSPNRLSSTLHDFVEEVRPDWNDRSLRDLEALYLVKVYWPPSDYSGDDIVAEVTNTGNTYYEAMAPLANQPDNFRIPGSDRIVSIDHNSKPYAELVEKLENATEAIRGFNGETAYDKDQILGDLEAAKTLFTSTKVRVASAVTLALTPLYTAYHDAAAEVLKPILKEAIEAIKALLGL